jgi:moderate conductance mechanosensitive channel
LARLMWRLLVFLILSAAFLPIQAAQPPAETAQGRSAQDPAAADTGQRERARSSGKRSVSDSATPLKPERHQDEPNGKQTAKKAIRGQAPAAALSPAEQIAELQRAIQASAKQLSELKAEKEDPQSDFAKAEAEFNAIDKQLEDKKKAKAESEKHGKDAEARALETDLADLQKMWSLAKNRFELEISERKTLNQQVMTLEEKLKRDREELDRLTGSSTPPAKEQEAKGAAAQAPVAPTTPAAKAAAAPAQASQPPPAQEPASMAAGNPLAPALPAAKAGGQAQVTPNPPTVAPAPAVKKKVDKTLLKATQEAELKTQAAKEAEQEETSITARLADLTKSIALQRQALENSRELADNVNETRQLLAQELQAKSVAGAPADVLKQLTEKMREAEMAQVQQRNVVRERTDQLERLQTERASLLNQELAARNAAGAKEKEAEAANKNVQSLQNPLAPRNVLRWLIDHGVKLFAILVAMIVLHSLTKQFSRRVVHVIAHAGNRGAGTREEREARANTLVGVFQNAVSVTITVGGTLMIFEEAGIPVAPLLGGAAVFGLAVAFGAQNLIRDYFYGFVILLENQYKLNDVVKIGDVSGQVEQITLRMTVLRDLEGNVHFVPNGQVITVTNMTHGWSRALFDIGVAYKEDVDRVMAVLNELGDQLRKEPPYSAVILEPLTMLGVDDLADSAVIIKFYIKTRPLQQWTVKRELLRRIKIKFDELGIEIPFPHRTVFHRFEDGPSGIEALVHSTRLRHDAGQPASR